MYIDLLNLSPDILNHLPDDIKRVLGGKSWKVKEELIQGLLFQTVSKHYRDNHLSDAASTSTIVLNDPQYNEIGSLTPMRRWINNNDI